MKRGWSERRAHLLTLDQSLGLDVPETPEQERWRSIGPSARRLLREIALDPTMDEIPYTLTCTVTYTSGILAGMQRTTIGVTPQTRDRFNALLERSGAGSADALVRRLIFAHECGESLTRLDANPEEAADYHADVQTWTDTDMGVSE